MIKKFKIDILGLLLILSLCSACQANPEEPYIVNKTESNITSDTYQNEVLPQSYEVPDSWTDEFKTADKITQIKVDASIEFSDATTFPIIQAKPAEISQEVANRLIEGSFGKVTLYKPKTESDMTKSDIEAEILRIKKGETGFAEADYKAYIKSREGDLADLEKKHATAPDEYIPQVVDGKFTSLEIELPPLIIPEGATEEERKNTEAMYKRMEEQVDSVQTIDVEAQTTKQKPARLTISKSNEWDSMAYFTNIGENQREPGGKEMELYDKPMNLMMSVDEAKKIALNLAQDLNMGDYQIVSISIVPSGNTDNLTLDSISYEKLPKCYKLYLTKKICDIPITWVLNSGNSTEYAPRWDSDVLSICVDDTGVLMWHYSGVTEIGDTVNENVELLPFDQIKKKFESHMATSNFYLDSVVSKTITIDKIKFGMCRIATGESEESFVYVPVWDFFGEEMTQFDETIHDANYDENNRYQERIFGHSYLTINAIDGSIIDRGLGY